MRSAIAFAFALFGMFAPGNLASAASVSYVYKTISLGSGVGSGVGINDAGQVAGSYLDANSVYHGFVDTNGKIVTIDDPGAIPVPDGGTNVTGINNSGQIVGYYNQSSQPIESGFLYSNETFRDIQYGGALGTYPEAISNSGNFAGFYIDQELQIRGFLGSVEGGLIPFDNGLFPDRYKGIAGINAYNAFIGGFAVASDPSAFNYLFDAGLTRINIPSPDGTVDGINDKGQIVGRYFDESGSGLHGFIDTNGTFTTLDVPGSAGTEATGINNLGQIVGTYDLPGTGTAAIFVATPTPEPSSFVFLTSGFLVLGLLTRRIKRQS